MQFPYVETDDWYYCSIEIDDWDYWYHEPTQLGFEYGPA